MSPRKAKPPAIPVEMPRTERDLDRLVTAIEQHEAEGHRIGRELNNKHITTRQALSRAGDRDEGLYNLRDVIMEKRAKEMDEQIAAEGAE